MLSLIVKGNRMQALAAARAQGMEVERVHAETASESVLIAAGSVGQAVRWYCEAPATVTPGGYPAGTLLHYREV